MAYLIGQLTWWLVAVGAAAAVSGWALHLILNARKLADLEKERDKLRGEFLGFFHSEWQPLKRSQADDRELDTMRTRVTLANAHAAALERAMGELRDRRDELLGRIAELERALESKDSPDLQGEVSRLQGLLDERPDAEAMNALAWRLRYFEARTKYLESGGRLREGADNQPLAAMQAERDAARAEASELRARLADGAQPAGGAEGLNSLSWRARYLDARVKYLESEARPKAPGVDAETAARRDWRARYVERRVRHLQNELKAARIEAGALAAARTRIGELEAASSLAAPEGELKRLRWRERYLDARVRHLESRLTGAGAPVAQLEPGEDARLPIETPQRLVGGGVRPASIAAPRQGAPDDLTLIEGIGPKTENSLHALGVFHFDQIADWSRANCAWVDQYLRLRGRIERERWVEQARALARGARQRHQLYLERELV
ncbi:MAG: hypothetical protein JNJ73_05985 [Hyphomonadaceae bacterium]|nr:hypothetical protein [Hyphomonadaceae bacterium]